MDSTSSLTDSVSDSTRRLICASGEALPASTTSSLQCMQLCARCKVTRLCRASTPGSAELPIPSRLRYDGLPERRESGRKVIQIPPFKLGDLEEGCSFCNLIKAVISIEFPGSSASDFIVFNDRNELKKGHTCPDLYIALATEEAVAAYPAPISSLANMKPDELDQYLIGINRTMPTSPDRSELAWNILRPDDPRIIETTSRPLACLKRERKITSQARRTIRILLARTKQWVASQAWLKNDRILLTCPDDKTRIDFSKLSSWISGCRNAWPCAGGRRNHILCNGPKSSMDFMTTRLIDCTTREIVLNDQHMPYLALSYVWGETVQGVERSATGKPVIPATIPQTIADAMVVVRSLGMKYLWVDRYCILEEDGKMLQIQNMNLIYGNALCAIVALEGVNADAGLPGVSCARTNQHHWHTKVGTYSAAFPLNKEIEKSRWIQRGWTYQELFISRRCILFNQSQALFVCKGDMPGRASRYYKSEAGCSSGDNLPEITLFDIWGDDNTHTMSKMLWCFQKHLDGYSNRSLTNEADAIDAFKGILSVFSSFYFWGTPILPRFYSIGIYTERVLKSTMNVGFIAGLMWKRHGTLEASKVPKRRAGFPSWCWASLPVRTELLDTGSKPLWSDGKFYDGSLQSLQVKTPDGERTTLLGLHAWRIEWPRRKLDVNPTIELTVNVAQIKLVHHRLHCCYFREQAGSADHAHAYVQPHDDDLSNWCIGQVFLDQYDDIPPHFLSEKLFVVKLWEIYPLEALVVSWDGGEDSIAHRVGILVDRKNSQQSWLSAPDSVFAPANLDDPSIQSLQREIWWEGPRHLPAESLTNGRLWTKRRIIIE